MKSQYIQGEINARKSLLESSDYELLKLVENMADCTTITQLISVFKSFLADFGELVKKRRAWREEINTLEVQLEEAEITESLESDSNAEITVGETSDSTVGYTKKTTTGANDGESVAGLPEA